MSRRRKTGARAAVLLVDKPAGATSHDVVGWVRWATRAPAGHCGTLDPAATGLLVVPLGNATRLSAHLTGQDKTYAAKIVLGISTTTADAEGETLERADCGALDVSEVECRVLALRGEHLLAPPVYSAVKVEGVRAHAAARRGEAIELEPRPMAVLDVRCRGIEREGARVVAEVVLTVSKGTYIRSLAIALGRALGVPSHLGALRRLASGPLRVDDPRVVQGLQARPLPSAPGEKPRTRIRPRQEDVPEPQSREAQGAWLAAHGIEPIDALPFGVVRLPTSPEGSEAMRRLVQGQSIALEHPGLRGVEIPEGPMVAVTPADSARTALLLARLETRPESPGQRVLQPARLITPPT